LVGEAQVAEEGIDGRPHDDGRGVEDVSHHVGPHLDAVSVTVLVSEISSLYPELDRDLLIVGAILHDIGKTVGLNLVSDFPITEEIKTQVVGEYHESIGYMVTSKWNFAEVLRVCARCHHHPDQAPEAHKKMVETIFLADLIANKRDVGNHVPQDLSKRDINMIDEIRKELEGIMETVNSIL